MTRNRTIQHWLLSTMWIAMLILSAFTGWQLFAHLRNEAIVWGHVQTLQIPLHSSSDPNLPGTIVDPYAPYRISGEELGRMGWRAKSAVPALLDLAGSDDEVIRAIAARALEQIEPDTIVRPVVRQEH